jgi:hypothetical protein
MAVAILNGVFIISLFFQWGAGGARAWDADSVWLAFVAALVGGLIALADAFDYEVPRLPGSGASAYLSSVTLIYTLIALMDIRDQSWGIIVSLIVSIAATTIAFGTWRADRA